MPIVLGIDPGSRVTGFGVLQYSSQGHPKPTVITAGRIVLKQKDLAQRLSELHQEILALITEFKPDQAAVEKVFVKHYPAAALTLGHARGAILVALAQHGLQISEHSPRLIKKNIVGTGSADKTQVAHMVKQLLKLDMKVAEDTSDALAVALCHVYGGAAYQS